MARRTVLILGANGRFGAAAVEAFAAAGWRVLAQVRRAPAHLPEGAEALRLPLEDAAALADAAAGAEVVVHAVNPPYDQWDAQVMPLGRQGMDVAERLDAVFMLPGNVYGFGEDMPARLTEDDGWPMGFVVDLRNEATDLVILNADDFEGAPQASIRIPHRIPPGFHGNWAPTVTGL